MIDECMFQSKLFNATCYGKKSCKYMYVIQVEIIDKLMFISKFLCKN